LLGATTLLALVAAPAGAESIRVNIRLDASQPGEELKPIWRFFGADEPNYAYMTNGQKLLAELGELSPRKVYFRTHNLMTSGDGTPALKWGSTGAYAEDADGHPVYQWAIVDRIFRTYLERGVRPYVQIGFMPKDLSMHPEPYQHHWTPKARYDEIYTGWAYPPKDYTKWAGLVYEWARHCVETYGRAEVESWYWEVWNEPNIGYWRGTPAEFQKLHDFAIDAVKRAVPEARVGGPDVAGSGGRFMREFLEHCLRGTNYATGKIGTPLDFVSFHAKGAPTFTNGHVTMGIASQLRTLDDGFRIIASYPELRGKPVIIGETDPDGCAACTAEFHPQNGYRNGPLYASYTAASFARHHELAQRHGVNLEGALTWAFEFEQQPFFAGFRSLADNGIDKPVLNVFRMFSRMAGKRLRATSDGERSLDEMRRGVRQLPDVAAFASSTERKIFVLVWHYHDEDIAGPDAEINLSVENLPAATTGPLRLEHFRIDENHSNAYNAWKRMGSPASPTPIQYVELEMAGRLAALSPAVRVNASNGRAEYKFSLPRQGVSLLELGW